MQNNLKKNLIETNFKILQEISKETVYKTSHPSIEADALFISQIDEKILFSINVGELKKVHPVKVEKKIDFYCQKFTQCWKEASYEIYKPLEALEKSLNYEAPQDGDSYYDEFKELERLFPKESFLLKVHRVDIYLVFDFTFKCINLQENLNILKLYFIEHKIDITNIIK